MEGNSIVLYGIKVAVEARANTRRSGNRTPTMLNTTRAIRNCIFASYSGHRRWQTLAGGQVIKRDPLIALTTYKSKGK